MNNQFRFGIRVAVRALIVLAATTCRAAENGLSESSGDRNELVGGDWYDVKTERRDGKQPTCGMLVKVTDDWVVLGVIRCQANRTEIPWLGEMPFIGGAFRRDENITCKVYQWIPRTNVTVQKRSVAVQKVKDEFKDDRPTLESSAVVHWNDGTDRTAAFKEANDKKITVEWSETALRIEETRLSKLPIVGGAFTRQRAATQEVQREISLSDVLFIESQVDLTPEEIKLVHSQ